MSDYAQRLAAHPRWRWEPGMVDTIGAVPDIHHPATRGWLLHMLREATGIVDACALSDGETWDAGPTSAALRNEFGEPLWAGHATEGDALAAALLAVWGAS